MRSSQNCELVLEFHDDPDQQTMNPHDWCSLPMVGWLDVLVRCQPGFRTDD